jgi:hypothetical protein
MYVQMYVQREIERERVSFRMNLCIDELIVSTLPYLTELLHLVTLPLLDRLSFLLFTTHSCPSRF